MKHSALFIPVAALAVFGMTASAEAGCCPMTIGRADFQWAMANRGGWVADAYGNAFPTARFTSQSGMVCQPPTGGDMSYCGRVTGVLYKITGSRNGPPRFIHERCK
jgi:hypothetical protein